MMSQPPKPVQVHQALHGYKDGHRLISSSCKLSRSSEKIMLALSDLSGRSMRDGFEENITGYPLPDDGYYVLAKTWYAPEMSRPGCVWTHSLLIDFPTLAFLKYPGEIKKHFARPDTVQSSELYGSKIISDSGAYLSDDCLEFSDHYVKLVLKSLYNKDGNPVVILKGPEEGYENLIMALWAQQWPKLRRSFSFSTNALSPRNKEGKLLDFQIVSHAASADLRSRYEDAILIEPILDTLSFGTPSKWIDLSWHDLAMPGSSDLRAFLKEFGSEHKDGRKVFSDLVETYSLLKTREPNLESMHVYAEIAKRFPTKQAAKHLKKALTLEPVRASQWLKNKWAAHDVMRILENKHLRNSFDIPTESLPQLVSDSWEHDHADPIQILSHIPKRTKGRKEVIHSIVNVIQPGDISLLTELDTSDKVEFFKAKPSLLLSEAAWEDESVSYAGISGAVDYIFDEGPQNYKDTIVRNILWSENREYLSAFLKRDPSRYMFLILSQIASMKSDKQPHYLDIIGGVLGKTKLRSVLNWLNTENTISIPILLWAFKLIGPFNTESLINVGDVWRPLTKVADKKLSSDDHINISVGLLLVAFKGKAGAGEALAVSTYKKVIRFVEMDQLTQEAHEALSKALPAKQSFFSLFPQTLKIRLEDILLECIRRQGWSKSNFPSVRVRSRKKVSKKAEKKLKGSRQSSRNRKKRSN